MSNTIRLAALLVSLAAAVGAQVSFTGLTKDERRAVDALVTTTQAIWNDKIANVRELAERRPKETIAYLITKLDDGTDVYGLPDESQVYSVCGNALSLLERLTMVRICGQQGRWLGFSTHDHRGATPSADDITNPWKAWLERRADIPTTRWFWGLSLRELDGLRRVLRTPAAKWTPVLLADATNLGKRAYPCLLAMLLDNQWAAEGRQFCEQANDLLARLTTQDPVPMPMVNPLQHGVGNPDRGSLGTEKNRTSRRLAQQTWMVRLIG